RASEIGRGCLQSRREAGGEAHGENYHHHDGENREVRTKIKCEPENSQSGHVRFEIQQSMKAVFRQRKSEQSARGGNDGAIQKKLTNKSGASGAERGANQDFMTARAGEGE